MYFASSYHFTQSIQTGLDKLLGFIPQIIGLILLLLIGWLIARVVKSLTRVSLRKLRFDRAITKSPAGDYITRIIEHPTEFVSRLAYWIIFLMFISFAISSLGVPALTLIVNGVYKYIPNIIAAVIIFLAASAITAGAEAFVKKMLGSGALAKLISTIVPAVIMPIAIFMILSQLHIAQDIIDITFTALVGAVALGLALAFGLGGRDVASEILQQAYDNAQDKSGELKMDVQRAKRNVQAQSRRTQENIES